MMTGSAIPSAPRPPPAQPAGSGQLTVWELEPRPGHGALGAGPSPAARLTAAAGLARRPVRWRHDAAHLVRAPPSSGTRPAPPTAALLLAASPRPSRGPAAAARAQPRGQRAARHRRAAVAGRAARARRRAGIADASIVVLGLPDIYRGTRDDRRRGLLGDHPARDRRRDRVRRPRAPGVARPGWSLDPRRPAGFAAGSAASGTATPIGVSTQGGRCGAPAQPWRSSVHSPSC